MSIASYMRKLIASAIQLEKMGYFAPKALEDKKLETILSTFNFAYIPLDILSLNGSVEKTKALGEMIGKALKEMGIDIYTVVEYLGASTRTIVSHGDRIVIVPTPNNAMVSELVKGIARGGGLEIQESGGLAIINIPKSTLEKIKSLIDKELEE